MDTDFLPATVELAWDIRCGTGESPVWSEARGEVLFCDIPAGRIHAFNPVTRATASWRLPGVVASFGLCRSGRLVVAMRDRVVLYDLDRERMADLAGPLDLRQTSRFNDGKVGPDGAFWVGTIDTSRAATSHLYRVTPDGRIEAKVEGLVNSNGLAWSPDGRTMFHADTRPGIIAAWDFDAAAGEISNRREIARIADADGRPDGGATDSDGRYWSAGVSASWLNRFELDGTLSGRVALPYPGPTMPCFTPHGLFVTSLREGRDPAVVAANPTMGGLLRVEVAMSGAPVGVFGDE